MEVKRFLPGGAMETVAYDAEGAETGQRLDYLLSDHLGSVVAVVEGTETPSGQTKWDVREERAFDPWGACRDPDSWKACAKDSVLPKDDGATRRGFTGHGTLGAVGLVHMNGRIYDPALGRFLQADPYVQSASDLQGLNRYAYVLMLYPCAIDSQVATCSTADREGAEKKHPPLAPLGVDIYENMRIVRAVQIEQMHIIGVSGLYVAADWFRDQVTDRWPWD